MNKRKLFLSIPKPCDQLWETMQEKGEGRFCEKCQHTIIDFSQMTDKELLQYLNSNPAINCGRFDSKQLGRAIELKEPKTFLPASWKKIAATVVTVASLSRIEAQVQEIKNDTLETVQKTIPGLKETILPKPIKIFITIKDGNEVPVKNIKISSPVFGDHYSDINGQFSIVLKPEQAVPQSLTFSGDSMVTVVRSFHPGMGSMNYNIKMHKYENRYCHFNTGIMARLEVDSLEKDLPSVYFDKNSISINKKTKDDLSKIALLLKDNPEIIIDIIAYTPENLSQTAIANKRLGAIVFYLVEKMGISEDRLTSQKVFATKKVNRVDFKPH